MSYYVYGSDAFYNQELDELIPEIEKSLETLNSSVCEWLQSNDMTKRRLVREYHKQCLQPLRSHFEVCGGLANCLADPLTMLILVNCITNTEFYIVSNHWKGTYMERDIIEFEENVARLVTVMILVQKSERATRGLMDGI
jgi:hypothetical protein